MRVRASGAREEIVSRRQRRRDALPNNDEGEVDDETMPPSTELEMRRMESARWLSIYGRKFRGRGETTTTVAYDDGGGGGGAEDGSGTRRRRNNR